MKIPFDFNPLGRSDAQVGPDYLTFTAISSNAVVRIDKFRTSNSDYNIFFSFDGKNWSKYSWPSSSSYLGEAINLQIRKKVMLKGNINENIPFNMVDTNYNSYGVSFNGSGDIKVSGNVLSLIDSSMQMTSLRGLHGLEALFSPGYVDYTRLNGFSSIDASELRIPVTSVDSTSMNGYAMSQMFLDANAQSSGVVGSCAIIPPKEIFALTSDVGGGNTFSYMFAYTNITKSPLIHLDALNYRGFRRMFQGCANLTEVTVDWSAWPSAEYATAEWLDGVAATGTFHCPAGLTIPSRDENGVPAGWEIVNDVTA